MPDNNRRPESPTGERIAQLRRKIDDLDAAIIRLLLERTAMSRQIGRLRQSTGGTRVAPDREQEIVRRYHEALGEDGTHVALVLLQAGRGNAH